MIRRKSSFSLAKGATGDPEGVNPLDSVSNFGDLMLVLCAAMIVALINFWGVDISSASTLAEEKMQQVTTDLAAGDSTEAPSGDQYEAVGTVYKDKATGELWLLEE